MSNAILGDLSPERKRYIAQDLPENGAPQQLTHSPGERVRGKEGPRLAENVHVLAANLNRLMEHHKGLRTGLGSNGGVAKATGLSSNTVGRLRRGDGSVTIGTLAKIAKAFKVPIWELAHPGFTPQARLEIIHDPTERAVLQAHRGKPPTQH